MNRYIVEDRPSITAFDHHRGTIAMGSAQGQGIERGHMSMSLGDDRLAVQLQLGKGIHQADPRCVLQIV